MKKAKVNHQTINVAYQFVYDTSFLDLKESAEETVESGKEKASEFGQQIQEKGYGMFSVKTVKIVYFILYCRCEGRVEGKGFGSR